MISPILIIIVLMLVVVKMALMAMASSHYKTKHNVTVDELTADKITASDWVGADNYLGTWNANTNSPTLADGTGDAGDYYRVSTGGTQDLGSGSVDYTADDIVIYNGTIWQKIDASVTAAEVPIADAGGIITATDVEGALQENRTAIDLNTTHASSDGSDHTFIDQDVTSGATPTFGVGNMTGEFSGSLSEDTDGIFSPDFMSGAEDGGGNGGQWIESGSWSFAWATGLPALIRTSNNNTTEYYHVPLPLKAKSTASKGVEITAVKMAYECNTSDAGDDIQLHLCKRSIPADGNAPGALTTIAGDADADYDADHNTAAKRVDETGAPEQHTLLMSVPGGDQAYIADDEAWFLRIKVVEANDVTAALDIVIRDIQVKYNETIA